MSGLSSAPAGSTRIWGRTLSSRWLTSPCNWYVPLSSTAIPSARSPQVLIPRSITSHNSSPVGVVLCSPGWITACGAVAGSSAIVYGSGPRMIATSPGRSGTGAPRSGTTHAVPRSMVTRVRAHDPGSVPTRAGRTPTASGTHRAPSARPAVPRAHPCAEVSPVRWAVETSEHAIESLAHSRCARPRLDWLP